ncbi:hypothetical protein MTP99_017333 [Tenebrio molitor]|nr:hypothetical protein MTP99_017333 [Tenebrio molitor]
MSVKAWKAGSGRFLSKIGLIWSGPGAFVFFKRGFDFVGCYVVCKVFVVQGVRKRVDEWDVLVEKGGVEVRVVWDLMDSV